MTPADLYFESRVTPLDPKYMHLLSPPRPKSMNLQNLRLNLDLYLSCTTLNTPNPNPKPTSSLPTPPNTSKMASQPITELALLRLSPTTTLNATKPLLAHIAHVTEAYTKSPDTVQFWQQTEDPTLIYLFGAWTSLSQHLDGFIPSPANQSLLADADGKLSVELLAHYDVPLAALPTSAAVLSVARHFVEGGEEGRRAFGEVRERVRGEIEGWVTEGTPAGGWRVDAEKGREEFVLVAGWRDVEQHVEFGSSESFERYKEIRDVMDGFEVRHARRIEL